MARWTWLLTAALALVPALPVSADDSAQIYPLDTVPDWLSKAEILLEISATSSEASTTQYSVAPLTSVQGLNGSEEQRKPIYINGNIVLATDENYVNLSGDTTIAYLSCDDMDSSFIDQNMMLSTLMANAPSAILLYSQTNNCCIFDSATAPSYTAIFTMLDQTQAAMALNVTESGRGAAHALISGNLNQTDTSDDDSQGGSKSAIAMSILYSITGLITLLFLAIIATGAIRAHRYPERYGPRGAYGGRPRQSRAKGIARAVLETLPIVKFGDPTPAKPDPDVELENAASQAESSTGTASHEGIPAAGAGDVQTHQRASISGDAGKPDQQQQPAGYSESPAGAAEQDSGMGAASGSKDAATTPEENHLGCSICTEDFTVGEDVRVLPCNHKYHPACIDPWLINVSGTCPLCRLDLRPDTEEAAEGSEDQTNLPPPLEADENTAAAAESSAAHHRHRASRLFDLNRLRHASVEERIEVLRRYRHETQAGTQYDSASTGSHNAEDERSRSAKLTRRLRDKFRVRTRTQSPGGSGGHGPAASRST